MHGRGIWRQILLRWTGKWQNSRIQGRGCGADHRNVGSLFLEALLVTGHIRDLGEKMAGVRTGVKGKERVRFRERERESGNAVEGKDRLMYYSKSR